MIYEAILKTESYDAENIADALNTDNNKESFKGLKINTKISNRTIKTKIKTKSVRTLLNTLDDLILCQITAERVISIYKKKGKRGKKTYT